MSRQIRRRSRFSSYEKLAYRIGRIESAKPGSRVNESYMNGKTGRTTRNRKPLF